MDCQWQPFVSHETSQLAKELLKMPKISPEGASSGMPMRRASQAHSLGRTDGANAKQLRNGSCALPARHDMRSERC
eukprot:scaffold233252_cov19-Prasinocladus_malaysianus.AAC.1